MTSLVRDALLALDKDALVLSIHSQSFPQAARDDVGRGTLASAGTRDFLAEMSRSGFTGILLGPEGQTSRDNPSPYDGSLFSRSVLSLDLRRLAEQGLLRHERIDGLVRDAQRDPGDRIHHAEIWRRYENALSSLVVDPSAREFWRQNEAWLVGDALFDILTRVHGDRDFTHWPTSDRDLWRDEHALRRSVLLRRHEAEIERYAFLQSLVHTQHEELRTSARALGLELYGDLQVGISRRELWRQPTLFLPDLVLGAPPSRTNPAGQPWGYPVLDPQQYTGAALEFVRARVEKMLGELDGLRIDHPHGLVCPWVYDASAPDPLLAVQAGARLFSSPDIPRLADYAIATLEQLDFSRPRYADDFVRQLDDAQVQRFSLLFELLVRAVTAKGGTVRQLLCEVLSTEPYELGRVRALFGLGRFRVTQKARLDDPSDVYRSENALSADWIMMGNHDTPPIWHLLERWFAAGEQHARAAYLAERLTPDTESREAFARTLASDPGALAEAMLADLFASPARHVLLFWTDLFGLREIYNHPGEVRADNWTLRLPSNWRERHAEALARGAALSLPRALGLALRARGRKPELASALLSPRER